MRYVKKYWFVFILLLLMPLLWIVAYFMIDIKLNGDEYLEIEYGDVYTEEGAIGYFNGREIDVNIRGEIDTKKVGEQEVIYSIDNKLGMFKRIKRRVVVVDKEKPVLTLKGSEVMTLRLGDKYQEPGYVLDDNVDGDITDDVIINGNVDVNKIGNYEIVYEGYDSSGNYIKKTRFVRVIDSDISYQDSWDNIDNTPKNWWSGNKKNNTRPETGAGATSEFLKQYDAYYMGSDEKVIYLTFDEGSNLTYTKEIADVLYKNDVRATFFFCGNFIKDNPDLMKQLVEQGHSIGNHGYHHLAMHEYANRDNFDKFKEEIFKVEEVFYEITGVEMDKVYREPRGEYSERDLAILKAMGYKTFFWSADYYDFAYDVTSDVALNNYLQRYHNGAIYLIHPKNKGNYLAMDSFVKEMKKLGYEFGLVRDIN